MGNRAQKTDSATGTTGYTVDAANRLLTAGANTYASDLDGNTLTDGTRTNVWDSQNRLVSCTSGGVTSTYTYGADGLRRSATVNGTTTYYVYDGQTLIREMQQNAQGVLQSTATYLCGPRGPEYRRDDTQAEGTYTDGTGTHPAGKTRWYVYDGLGSVVGEVDPSGNMTSSDTFDVYGAKRAGGTGTTTSRQGFVGSLGHITDTETGLVYMRARYYDPNVGRFTSEDPKQSGSNWFAYVDNDPVNNADPDGKDKQVIGAVAALAGITILWYAIFFRCTFNLSDRIYLPAVAASYALLAGAIGVGISDSETKIILLTILATSKYWVDKEIPKGGAAGIAETAVTGAEIEATTDEIYIATIGTDE